MGIRTSTVGRSLALASVLLGGCGPDAGLEVAVEEQGDVQSEADAELAYPGQAGVAREGVFLIHGEALRLPYQEVAGEAVFEGDIILRHNEESPLGVEGELGTGVQQLAADPRGLWPFRRVYYAFHPDLTARWRVRDAIAHWEAKTDVRFVLRTNQPAYVVFRPSSGCSATLGYTGGKQFVNLAKNCSTGNVIHEIGHTLGLWHEQSRADRDDFVNIRWANIQAGAESNFRKYSALGSGRDVKRYDYRSIMHYGSYAFSSNGRPTIVKKDGSLISGNRSSLSEVDVNGVAQLYTSAGADISPPSVPTGLRATSIGRTSVTLDWANAWDNTAVVGYRIKKYTGEWVRIGTSASSTFVVDGLSPGATYYLGVTAYDAAGHESELSAWVTVTTAS